MTELEKNLDEIEKMFKAGIIDVSDYKQMKLQITASIENIALVETPKEGASADTPPPLPGRTAPSPDAPKLHVSIDGADVVILDRDEVIKKIKNKEIKREAMVWRKGMSDWVEAGKLPELEDVFSEIPPPPPPSKKTAAQEQAVKKPAAKKTAAYKKPAARKPAARLCEEMLANNTRKYLQLEYEIGDSEIIINALEEEIDVDNAKIFYNSDYCEAILIANEDTIFILNNLDEAEIDDMLEYPAICIREMNGKKTVDEYEIELEISDEPLPIPDHIRKTLL